MIVRRFGRGFSPGSSDSSGSSETRRRPWLRSLAAVHMRSRIAGLAWTLLVCVYLCVCASGFGCKRGSADGPDAGPPPVVRETNEGLVFTYIDDHGEFHVVGGVADVPEAARETVRVIDPSRDEGASGDTVFIADLRAAGADGTFPVRRMKRSELEALALARRPGAAAASGSSAPGNANPNGQGSPNSGAPLVTIYGASWCGPCHQAEAFLTRRGIPFVKKDIEEDHQAAREMQAKLAKAGKQGGSIPVLDVKGTILIGFSPEAVERALRI